MTAIKTAAVSGCYAASMKNAETVGFSRNWTAGIVPAYCGSISDRRKKQSRLFKSFEVFRIMKLRLYRLRIKVSWFEIIITATTSVSPVLPDDTELSIKIS
ncbi:hypothetical protein [Peribacillus simplex]|uniref:hypothetical protein n=1 Tax=Peribacillus simplex TaxID=1478 RepID=UPI003D26DEF3